MSFFPRFVSGEVAPIFRLLDEYTNQIAAMSKPDSRCSRSSLSTFKPKFDVKENQDSYELHGELPGIDQKDVSIEFTDPQVLSIRGRTEHNREEGERAVHSVEGQSEQSQVTEGGEQEGYHKPTVEDENATPADTASESWEHLEDTNEVAHKSQQQQQQQRPKPSEAKYWLSERSVGEFARSFSFPVRVDQDGVKASLRGGVLSIVVPKAAVPQSRRINIE
ncbi:hypothetical protein LTR08_000712 [Meristemomyces frigidus]|nr:hypothetical protein LTR08_000712 [Meristemomyces frigidus]